MKEHCTRRLQHLLMAGLLALTSLTGKAQTETDTTFRTQMNTIFANLDKSKVPYGLLRDYAMEFTNLECYNGTAALMDSNYIHANAFWSIYNTLSSARVNTASNFLQRADSLDLVWYNSLKTDTIVLAGLYIQYARFKDNAYPTYLTVTSNKIYDKYVSGVWQNPYQAEAVFALSPPAFDYTDTLGYKLLLPANLWQTNGSFTSLSIDAGDGLGYRTLTPGTVLTLSYSSPGLKEWKYRLTLSGSNYLYAHSVIAIGQP